MELVLDALLDALIDSAKMIPLLFVIYVAIEALTMRFGGKMGVAVAQAGKAGPAVGALLGVVPQCGFSVIATALYTQRFVTIGTLFAVYLATSDEAIPVILSQPGSAGLLVPLIATKLVVAIAVGYALDLVFRKRNRDALAWLDDEDAQSADGETPAGAQGDGADGLGDEGELEAIPLEDALQGQGCGCGCCVPAEPGRWYYLRALVLNPLLHTLQVWVFIFLTSFVIALAFGLVGQDTIAAFLEGRTVLQPVLAALVGLIPNCAASVAVTQFYLEGVITFGAAIAGLCASGGLGVLVLVKEGEHREAAAIVAGLWAIAVLAGLAVQALGIGA